MNKELPIKIELPGGFLEEEVRCEYTISKEMKEVWAVQLDLYAELKRVCDKYDLKLIADGGTTLGAVRHSGYIPWDDDLDFMMFRNEYDKLCEVAPSEFKEPYFWQTGDTDPACVRLHGQLRNSKTTGILKSDLPLGPIFNQGIFIDVFPYDSVPNSREEIKSFLDKLNHMKQRIYRYRDLFFKINQSEGIKKTIKNVMFSVSSLLIKNRQYNNKSYERIKKEFVKYNNQNSDFIITLATADPSRIDKVIQRKEWYTQFKPAKFEMTEVLLQNGFDEYLTNLYGDYHKYVIGGSLHGDVIFDPYTSYKEYYEKLENSKQVN